MLLVTSPQVFKAFDCGPNHLGSNLTSWFEGKCFLYPSSPWKTSLWLKMLERLFMRLICLTGGEVVMSGSG